MKRVLIALLALLLTACVSNQDSESSFTKGELDFAGMMIIHHEQAIVMADLALNNSENSEVISLANQIKAGQEPEILEMKSWGQSKMGSHAGHMMAGMLSDSEIAALEAAKLERFDALFLQGMIKHHLGAIEMAEDVADSKNPRVLALSQVIISSQRAEIERMKLLLKE